MPPMFFTPSGMMIEVNWEQYQKAPSFMLVTLEGISMDVKEEQP